MTTSRMVSATPPTVAKTHSRRDQSSLHRSFQGTVRPANHLAFLPKCQTGPRQRRRPKDSPYYHLAPRRRGWSEEQNRVAPTSMWSLRIPMTDGYTKSSPNDDFLGSISVSSAGPAALDLVQAQGILRPGQGGRRRRRLPLRPTLRSKRAERRTACSGYGGGAWGPPILWGFGGQEGRCRGGGPSRVEIPSTGRVSQSLGACTQGATPTTGGPTPCAGRGRRGSGRCTTSSWGWPGARPGGPGPRSAPVHHRRLSPPGR